MGEGAQPVPQPIMPESPVSAHDSGLAIGLPPLTALNWAAVSLPLGKLLVVFAVFFLSAIVVALENVVGEKLVSRRLLRRTANSSRSRRAIDEVRGWCEYRGPCRQALWATSHVANISPRKKLVQQLNTRPRRWRAVEIVEADD